MPSHTPRERRKNDRKITIGKFETSTGREAAINRRRKEVMADIKRKAEAAKKKAK